jgi:DNA-binding Lrp family transcriptional regulator
MGMSEAAVRRRVKNLVRQGIIRKFTVDLQASQIASALTLVAVTPGSPTSEVANKIKLLDNVSKVNEITGEYDIAIMIEAFTMEEVNNTIDQIRKTEGVASTNTMVILREVV